MSVPRYRPNKFFIPGLSDIWKGQAVINNDKTSRDRIKKKEMYKAYDESFAPLRVKSKKQSETSKKKKEMMYSFEDRKDKGLGAYRYFDDNLNNSSKKEFYRLKARDRSSFLESYRPTSRTSRNASTSRIQQSYSKDSYRRLTNRSKLQLEVQSASRLSDINPNDQLRLGKQLYTEGKLLQASKIFNQLLAEQVSVVECHYFIGVIQMRYNEYPKAIVHFKSILQFNQVYKKSTYLFLSMAYKGISDLEASITTANKGLTSFPNYVDLLMYRGKILMLNKQYQQADKDYSTVIGIKNNHTEAYFKKVECLLALNQFKKAITTLTTLMYIDEQSRTKILNQRAVLLFKINHIEECKKDIDRLIQLKSFSSQIYELKGCIEQMQGRITESVLCHEQSIRLNTCKKAAQRSLISITKFKINDLDYYAAHHLISRSTHLGLKSATIQLYRLFTEGIVFLMKRKTSEGVNNLNTLLYEYVLSDKKLKMNKEDSDRWQEHIDYILKRFYVYRAYGYFVLGQHELCIIDYNEGQKYTPIQRHGRYNLTLAEGIVQVKNRNFQKGYLLFQKAKTIYPNRIQPLLYKAVTLVQKSYCEETDQINRLESILSALKETDIAFDINNSHSNLCYLRTLLYYCLGKINEGLESISRAMAKSEQNVPKYFYYRGIGNGSLGNYRQCQNDFTIVINLDNQYSEAYLQRAKTLLILNNIQKGMDDIDQYIKLRPSVDRYYLQGNLHFSMQEFETAILKYEKAQKNQETILMKTKSYICIGELKFALTTLQQLNQQQFLGDLTILKYLINSSFSNTDTLQQYLHSLIQSVNTSHKIFNSVQVHHYIGAVYFQLKRYKQAEEQFRRAYKERQFLNIEHMINGEQYENDETGEESQLEMSQINYNLFLCYLMSKEMKKAYELFVNKILTMKDMIPQGDILTQLSQMVFMSIKGIGEKEEIVNQLDVTMFTNSLSDVASEMIIKLRNGQLKTKLCHILPSIVMRQMRPQVNQKTIMERIQLHEIENKPQPPWVRRNDESTLIFTGEIQNVGIQFETEQNQETSEYDQQQQKTEEEEQSSHYSTQDINKKEMEKRADIQKLKNAFKLNESVERKLNSFINKNNK